MHQLNNEALSLCNEALSWLTDIPDVTYDEDYPEWIDRKKQLLANYNKLDYSSQRLALLWLALRSARDEAALLHYSLRDYLPMRQSIIKQMTE